MGHAILYCSNCSSQVRESDFEARRAFRVEDQVFCKKCCKEILGREPEPALTPSSTQVKAHARANSSTARIPIATALPPRSSSNPIGLILGAVGAVVVVIVVALAVSGKSAPPPAVVRPAPAPPKEDPAPLPNPGPSPRETAAREALRMAAKFVADRPQDLDGQRSLYADAVARAAGTPLLEDARRELDRVDRKIRERDAAKVVPKPVEPPPPPPTPAPVAPAPAPAPAPPKEDPARVARWVAAVAPATARDYAAAVAALEKLGDAAPDVQILKSVATLHPESLQALLRTAKGQRMALDVRDPSGQVRRVEGAFAGEVDGRLEVRGDAWAAEIELGEILPSTLLRSRGAGVDPAIAAVYCLLEGDEEGARRILGDKTGTVPDRYWTYARSLPSDAAGGLYQEAVALEAAPATEADAIPKLQALLRDHAGSPFVRRNKASIASRVQRCARDFLFVATEFKAAGTFKPARTSKGGGCWTSENDVEAGKAPENFLELTYSAVPDTTYRCWIYAGGCCRETFEFWVQGTEMVKGKDREPVEPGSAAAAEVKPYLTLLKKSHSMHTGPKQPSSWEWIPIPLPKYAKAGTQRLRVISDQKGFSVAYACVSSTRTGPPRELDMRELEKTRGGPAPVAASSPTATVVWSLATDGTERQLLGELRDKSIYGVAAFNHCFLGREGGGPAFKIPTGPCEVRITYFLKTATPLTARMRIPRDGQSIAYDVPVKSEAGRAVELRIPLSEFKPAYGAVAPPIVAGDGVPMIYLFGEDPNCGLRVDAFSVVELKQAPPVTAATPAAPPAGKALVSENFDVGLGTFVEGEIVEGGAKGKACLMSSKGISSWGAWSLPVKETTTLSFKFKPLDHHTQIMILVWSEALKDNGRFHVKELRQNEWNEVRVKGTDLRIGASGDGRSIELINNIKIFLLNTDNKALIDDFEIRP